MEAKIRTEKSRDRTGQVSKTYFVVYEVRKGDPDIAIAEFQTYAAANRYVALVTQ